jgi:hypothetical protein
MVLPWRRKPSDEQIQHVHVWQVQDSGLAGKRSAPASLNATLPVPRRTRAGVNVLEARSPGLANNGLGGLTTIQTGWCATSKAGLGKHAARPDTGPAVLSEVAVVQHGRYTSRFTSQTPLSQQRTCPEMGDGILKVSHLRSDKAA